MENKWQQWATTLYASQPFADFQGVFLRFFFKENPVASFLAPDLTCNFSPSTLNSLTLSLCYAYLQLLTETDCVDRQPFLNPPEYCQKQNKQKQWHTHHITLRDYFISQTKQTTRRNKTSGQRDE